MGKIRIGVVPTKRNIFSIEDAKKYKDLIYDRIKGYDCEIVDIEDICENGMLYLCPHVKEKVDQIAEKFRDIDGLFLPHCDFGSEGLVSEVAAKVKKPVLLWGPSDELPDENGVISRYTQCGIFATGKVLQRYNVPFTYLVNSSVDSDVFRKGFERFLGVCRTVKAFYETRILQISTRPMPFWSTMCNEGELLEKFGIEVVPVTLFDLKVMMEDILAQGTDEDYLSTIDRLGRFDCSAVGKDVDKIAALKTAMKRLAEKHDCNSVVVQCWDAMQDMMSIKPCVSDGLLMEDGIPAICETDIHGAITVRMLSAAADSKVPFFSDITLRHPEKRNLQMFWHCGNFSSCLASESSQPTCLRDMILPSKAPGIGNFYLKEGNITITRFDGVHGEYRLFIGEAKAVTGPKASGTYVWAEIPDLDLWEYKLVTGPYIHHCAGVYDEVAPVLYEACKYIPGLSADPVQPTEEEIFRKWLKGQ